jgi:hypothetical protein
MRRWILLGILAVLVLAGAVLAVRTVQEAPEVTATETVPVSPPVARSAVPVLPVGRWEAEYLNGWEFERENGLPASRSGDSWNHYNLSYDVDANTAMFQATGQTRYLDRALEYVENVTASAKVSSSLPSSQYRDRFLGWISNREDLQPTGVEVPLYESYFWRHATTLLRVMRQTPATHDHAGYRQRYERLLGFAEEHVFTKWQTRGEADNIYRDRTHMAAHWAAIGLNLSLITTDDSRRTRYRTVVDTIDQRLRAQLRPNPADAAAYFWNDQWGLESRPGQDVSHANGVLSYLVEAKDHGTFWTDADMAAFSALLTKVVWPGGTKYAAYVDGTGSENGWFSDGFVKLGRYDAAVQQRLEQHEVANLHFAANMAYNASRHS